MDAGLFRLVSFCLICKYKTRCPGGWEGCGRGKRWPTRARINGTVNNSLLCFSSFNFLLVSFFYFILFILFFVFISLFFFCSVQRDALLCATDTGSLVCKNSRTKNIRAIPVRSERRNRGFVASLWHLCGIFSSMLRNVSPFGHHLKPRLTKSFSWLSHVPGFPLLPVFSNTSSLLQTD